MSQFVIVVLDAPSHENRIVSGVGVFKPGVPVRMAADVAEELLAKREKDLPNGEKLVLPKVPGLRLATRQESDEHAPGLWERVHGPDPAPVLAAEPAPAQDAAEEEKPKSTRRRAE